MRNSFDGDCAWENQGADYPVPAAMLGGRLIRSAHLGAVTLISSIAREESQA
jgi:hypothetical protein